MSDFVDVVGVVDVVVGEEDVADNDDDAIESSTWRVGWRQYLRPKKMGNSKMKRWRWIRVSTYRMQVAMTKAGEKMAMVFYLFVCMCTRCRWTHARARRSPREGGGG